MSHQPVLINARSADKFAANQRELAAAMSMSLHSESGFDHPTPTSFSHLAILSTSITSDSGDFGTRLPRLEEKFCSGFTCCGLDLADLHGLLEHFEECHVLANSPAPSMQTQLPPITAAIYDADAMDTPAFDDLNDGNNNAPAQSAASSRHNSPGSPLSDDAHTRALQDLKARTAASFAAFNASQNPITTGSPDSDADSMDLDDGRIHDPSNGFFANENTTPVMPFARRSSPTPLTLNALGNLAIPARPDFTTLRTREECSTPGSSAPGTPGPDYDALSRRSSLASLNGLPTPLSIYSSAADLFDIEDDFADTSLNDQRRSLSPQSSSSSGRHPSPFAGIGGGDALFGSAYSFTPAAQSSPSGPVRSKSNKPHKCPVPGCDKAYKQQNGLKYHRIHGHKDGGNPIGGKIEKKLQH